MSRKVTIVNQLDTRKVTKPVVTAVLATLTDHDQLGEVVVTLAGSATLQSLNREFAGQDRTTDVLTFPAPNHAAGILGDVIVNWDMAVIQAQRRQIKPIEEAAMLAVHGTLHLLGYDDHNEADRHTMIEAMNRAMLLAGLPQDHNWESVPYPEVAP
jgi:probable rRNA maturation factor